MKSGMVVRVRLDNVGPFLQALKELGLSATESHAEMVLTLSVGAEEDYGSLIGKLGAIKDTPGVVEAHYEVVEEQGERKAEAVQLPLSVQD